MRVQRSVKKTRVTLTLFEREILRTTALQHAGLAVGNLVRFFCDVARDEPGSWALWHDVWIGAAETEADRALLLLRLSKEPKR